jgi:hypothetical protein
MDYGVCSSSETRCSLSFEAEEFARLSELLCQPLETGTFGKLVQEFIRLFQRTEVCSECEGDVVVKLGGARRRDKHSRKLERALRLRNQLLGLGILPLERAIA